MLAGMDGRDGMRAADSDRQAIAERLRAALDEGRLDLHEYDDRLQRAYAARTYADLNALVGDLPASGGTVPAPRETDEGSPVVPDGGRGLTARWLVEVWEPWLKVVGIVVAVWVFTSLAAGEMLYFWPGWVAGPWGAVVLVRTVTGLATGEPQRQAIERERRRQRRAEKRALKRERKALAAEQADANGTSGTADAIGANGTGGKAGANGAGGTAGRGPEATETSAGEQVRRPDRGELA